MTLCYRLILIEGLQPDLIRCYAHLEERSLYQGFLTTLLIQALSNYI